jgi:hypothetical protein
MPMIYNISEPFDTQQLSLANPVSKNGAYFIKISAIASSLYFQAPKCTIKQGFITSGKKTFCDFVFSNEETEFLAWLESLEEKTRSILFANREKWFETQLDEHDIENSMTCPYKMYKSGKYYIIRANVPTTLGKCDLKIYDESEQLVDPETIQENTSVLVIFEFKGVRCSVRSFQFEIELKQMLIVEQSDIFEKCIIHPYKTSKPASLNVETSSTKHPEPDPDPDPDPEPFEQKQDPEPFEPNQDIELPSSFSNTLSHVHASESNSLEIMEVDFPLEELESTDTLKLKNRNDVYYKMYKEAKAKAKEAKQIAIMNYLEAKRIKTTYLLEDSDNSDLEDLIDTNDESTSICP